MTVWIVEMREAQVLIRVLAAKSAFHTCLKAAGDTGGFFHTRIVRPSRANASPAISLL